MEKANNTGGTNDEATVNVTNTDYSYITVTFMSFDGNGNPISETTVSNQTDFRFQYNRVGSYRFKVYDLYGCLSYLVVNVAGLIAPIPTPTPSVFIAPSASPSPSNSETSFSSSSSSTNTVFIGALSGAVVGTLLFAALIGAIIFFVISKRRRRNQKKEKEDKEPSTDVEMKPVVVVENSKANYAKGSEWDIKYSEIQVGPELGRGAFGVVYKCRWRNTDCVVKQLDIKKNDDHSIQQFLKEANNVRNLRSHPNVCTIFGVCTDPQYPICIVMEVRKICKNILIIKLVLA